MIGSMVFNQNAKIYKRNTSRDNVQNSVYVFVPAITLFAFCRCSAGFSRGHWAGAGSQFTVKTKALRTGSQLTSQMMLPFTKKKNAVANQTLMQKKMASSTALKSFSIT